MAADLVLLTPTALSSTLGPLAHELAGRGRNPTILSVREDGTGVPDLALHLPDSPAGSITLVGYSVAGGLAVQLAATLDNQVDVLVLISPVDPSLGVGQLAKALRRGTAKEWRVPAHIPVPSRRTAEALARTAVRFGDLQVGLQQVKVPVVAVCGSKDPTTNRGWLASATRQPKDCAYEITGARHALVAARPALLAAIISEHSLAREPAET